MLTFKVSSVSDTGAVAAAIADAISQKNEVALMCVGAAAINQSIKAVIVACEFMKKKGKTLLIEPSFQEVVFEDGPRTGVQLLVHPKKYSEKSNRLYSEVG